MSDPTDQLTQVVNNLLSSTSFRQSIHEALILSASTPDGAIQNARSTVSRASTSSVPSLRASTPSTRSSSVPALRVPGPSTSSSPMPALRVPGPSTSSSSVPALRVSVPSVSSAVSVSGGNSALRVQQQLSRLFRPYNTNASPRRPVKNKESVLFKKEFILLENPNQTKPLSGPCYNRAAAAGRTILTDIDKSWNLRQIRDHIRSIFQTFFEGEAHVDFEILIPSFKYLIDVNLKLQEQLNGSNMQVLYRQKPVYIRPTTRLRNEDNDVFSDSSDVADMPWESTGPTECTTSSTDRGTDGTNMNIDDSVFEDQMNQAIENSLNENTNDNQANLNLSATDLLEKHIREHLIDEGCTMFNIYRQDIWACALRAVKRTTFCPFKICSVKFTDIDNISEGAIDAGGPRREFFRLVLTYLKDSSIFEGPENNKHIQSDLHHLEENTYYHSGLMIAMSLFHGGPAPSFFSEDFYDLFLQKNTRCSDEALSQFIDGFKTLKFYDIVQENQSKFKDFFCYTKQNMTAECFNALFSVCLSEEGSNRRILESRALCYFRDLLVDCEEHQTSCTIEEILMFTTGLRSKPPLGFPMKPSIKFIDDNARVLPTANTCELSLNLPTCHENYDDFKKFFLYGIQEGMVFGFE